MRKAAPPLDRIMKHVVKHKESGHWEWIGKSRTGSRGEYGGTRLGGRVMSSHRAVWILLKGYVPVDLLHQCGMSLCCNPAHLREGTHRENLLEAVAARGGKGWGGGVPGDGHPMRKVTLAEELEIYKRNMAGESQGDLAKEYGVSQPCICYIIKRVRRTI